jgi:uncharacterized RDD family membrane protein YckC
MDAQRRTYTLRSIVLCVCAIVCWVIAVLAAVLTVLLFVGPSSPHGNVADVLWLFVLPVALAFGVLGYACWPTSARASKESANASHAG